MKPGPLTNWAIDVEAPGVRWLPEGPWTRGRLGTRLDCRIMVPLRTWRCRMRAISELLGQDLRCMERDNPSWPDSWQLGTEHELQMGDEAVARLRFQSGMPSDAELAGYRWTFEYRRPVTVASGRSTVLLPLVTAHRRGGSRAAIAYRQV